MPGKKSSRKGKNKKGRLEEEEAVRKQKVDEVKQRFEKLYEIYDPEGANNINNEDFPEFVRSLGLYPTNARLNELAALCREEEGATTYSTAKLEEVLIPLVIEAIVNPNSDLAPPSDELLLKALRSLDVEHKGHLTDGNFRILLEHNGEKFSPSETEAAIEEAVNPATNVIDLERYVGRLLYNSKLF